MESYDKYKHEILEKIQFFYSEGNLFEVIKLLENSELDFELCNELVRAYINAANRTSDPYSLFEKAQLILDKVASDGHNDAKWNFYSGYILYKKGLDEAALIRFDRAAKLVNINDSALMSKISVLLEAVKGRILLNSYKGIESTEKQDLLEKLENLFSKPSKLCSFNNVELYHIPPTKDHDYNLIVSVGMSALLQKSESSEEFYEIVLPLPKDYKFNPEHTGNFEVFMLIEVLKYLITEKNYVGFGYYLEREESFSKLTAFNGIMLSALGDYKEDHQQVTLKSGKKINLYQLIPLRPIELNFRKQHSAQELLEMFKNTKVMLTPFIATRDDVIGKIKITEK